MKNLKLKALLLTVAMTATLTACGKANVELNHGGSLTVELGTEVSTDLNTYVTVDDPEALEEMILDTSNVNTDVVGDYTATVTYKKDVFTFKVSVVDTIAPEVEVTDNKEVLVGDTLKVADVAKVTDLTDVTVTFEDGTDTWIAKEAGDVTLTVVATDANGNETKETVTVKVVEPEPAEAEETDKVKDEVKDEEPQVVTEKTDKNDSEVKNETVANEVVPSTTGTTDSGATNNDAATENPEPAPTPAPEPTPAPTPTPAPSTTTDSGNGSTIIYRGGDDGIQESLNNGGTIVSGGGSDIDEKIENGEKPNPDDL